MPTNDGPYASRGVRSKWVQQDRERPEPPDPSQRSPEQIFGIRRMKKCKKMTK